jgi:hypothetical protein
MARFDLGLMRRYVRSRRKLTYDLIRSEAGSGVCSAAVEQLLDHLVGAAAQRERESDAKCQL